MAIQPHQPKEHIHIYLDKISITKESIYDMVVSNNKTSVSYVKYAKKKMDYQ